MDTITITVKDNGYLHIDGGDTTPHQICSTLQEALEAIKEKYPNTYDPNYRNEELWNKTHTILDNGTYRLGDA